jgi:two-component system, OmpR family, sensor histidine kinase VicK
LWKEAIPADVRIKEIEQGILPDTIETLKEPSEILNLAYKLVNSANSETLIIFHTTNALLRQERSGGITLLFENAIKHKLQVRILVPIEDKIADTIQKRKGIHGIEIRSIEPIMQTRVTILVVDRKYSLVVELKDDTKEDIQEHAAIGLATYSNSKSTVLSYTSIFEALWRQSELYEELKNRSVAQKEFINIAAHELRNPIQPILGLSDILLRSDASFADTHDDKVKQRQIIEVIARNAKRLQRLTEDILDVSRIEGRTLNLSMDSVPTKTIGEMVEEYASEYWNRTNHNKRLRDSFLCPKQLDSISIIADQNRIRQVICNLLDNAVKFTRKGTITVSAEIDTERRYLIIRVKDTGSGIDSALLSKLFTKFVTKSEGGTGLGLYICKGIIEAHGGQIWASNRAKTVDGATSSFSLPLTQS